MQADHSRANLVLWATLFFCVACSGKPVPQISRLPADATILAFGDSLTIGTGTTIDQAYPAVLAALTGRKVINAGISGETTEGGRERLASVLDETQPRLVILCLGGNDMLHQQDRNRMRDNLDAMITDIRGRGIPVVLLGVPEPKLLSLTADASYRMLAEKHRLPLEETVIAEVLGKRSLRSDPVHPNAQGYREMAVGIARLLKKAGAI